MEGQLRIWRSARLCAIWVLIKHCGIPRDVVRTAIIWRLN